MDLPLYQVDAFADRPFTGNPAAVMPLDQWLPDDQLQALAMENNLSETAFFVALEDRAEADFHLRWFTPTVEVDLCGHATLATAHVLFEDLGYAERSIRFMSKSGVLTVVRDGEKLVMDFPARPPQPHLYDDAVAAALGARPRHFMKARDLVVYFDDPRDVAALTPNFAALAKLKYFAVVATAPGGGDGVDFVSRFFGPAAGVDEDPVTGSAHAELFPFWGKKLNKTALVARQISKRGGTVWGRLLDNDRVEISGLALTYLKGQARL